MCSRCVLDTTDPGITFDESGVCNYCHYYDNVTSKSWLHGEEGKRALEAAFDEMKNANKDSQYDCILGLSGGVDSSYLAWLGKQYGLRMLAVHVDAGWNSELAVKNIENICKTLDIDLVTHVVDWNSMKELQRAFLKSGVVNQDIPQDHAFFAGLYGYAEKNNISYVLNGYNIASENTLPKAWQGHYAIDSRHMLAIYKRYGSGKKLKNFPLLGFYKYVLYLSRIKKMKVIMPLNFLNYNKEDAAILLQEKAGWRPYGAKHNESRFTKFHQNYFLPVKYGYDIRKAYLSSLILSGQKAKEAALLELAGPAAPDYEIQEDVAYVRKKLGFTPDEFYEIMAREPKSHNEFPSSYRLYTNIVNFYLQRIKKLPIE
jgi:N-acetyl sugar amidotransferase